MKPKNFEDSRKVQNVYVSSPIFTSNINLLNAKVAIL